MGIFLTVYNMPHIHTQVCIHACCCLSFVLIHIHICTCVAEIELTILNKTNNRQHVNIILIKNKNKPLACMCVRVFVCLSIYGWGKRQIHSLWKIATRGRELPGSSRNCYIYKIVLKNIQNSRIISIRNAPLVTLPATACGNSVLRAKQSNSLITIYLQLQIVICYFLSKRKQINNSVIESINDTHSHTHAHTRCYACACFACAFCLPNETKQQRETDERCLNGK